MTRHRSLPILHAMIISGIMELGGVGCVPQQPLLTQKPFAFSFPEDEEGEISRLESELLTQPDTQAKAGLLWKLALLYSHPENPHPDYQKAAARMNALSLFPAEELDLERIRYMTGLLKTMDRTVSELKKSKKQMFKPRSNPKKIPYDAAKRERQPVKKYGTEPDRLQDEIEDLKNVNKKLEDEVRSLQEKLETLKAIDLQLEERRRF